jgi:outer membrane receptor for ferrienterochelin and colicin
MSKLIVKNGELYDSKGIKQKLEFGNAEQIEAIRNYENKMKAFQKGLVVEPEYEIEATVEFQCTCGANKSVTKDIDTSDDLSDFDGYILNCKCGQNYEIELNDKDELVVKITYKK